MRPRLQKLINAKNALKQAIIDRNLPLLKTAIEQAALAGIPSIDLQIAKTLVIQINKENQAMIHLTSVFNNNDNLDLNLNNLITAVNSFKNNDNLDLNLNDLIAAVNSAVALGLNNQLIDQAQLQVKHLQKQLTAKIKRQEAGEELCILCQESGNSPLVRIQQCNILVQQYPTIIDYKRKQDEMTPLLILSLHNRFAEIHHFLTHFKALNARLCTTLNESALLLAVTYDNIQSCEMLLKFGHSDLVHVIPTDGKKQSPLHVAALYGRCKIATLLLQHGADPLLPDVNGDLPVHLACRNGHPILVELLLYASISLSIKNDKGMTPVNIAHARVPNNPTLNMILLDFYERESLTRRNQKKTARKQLKMAQQEKIEKIETIETIEDKTNKTEEITIVAIDWSLDPLDMKPPVSFANRKDKRNYKQIDFDYRNSGHPEEISSLDQPMTGYVSRFLKAYAMVWPSLLFGDNARKPMNVTAMVNEFVRHSCCNLPKNDSKTMSIWGHVRRKFINSHRRHPFQTLQQAVKHLKMLCQDAVRVGEGIRILSP